MKEKRERKTWRIDEGVNTSEVCIGDRLLIPNVGYGFVYDITKKIRVAFPQMDSTLVDIWYDTPRTGRLSQSLIRVLTEKNPNYMRIIGLLKTA